MAAKAHSSPRFFPAIGNHDWDVWEKRYGSVTMPSAMGGDTPLLPAAAAAVAAAEERRATLPHLQVFDYLGALPSAGPAHARLRHRRGEWYRHVVHPDLEIFCLNSNLRPLPASEVAWADEGRRRAAALHAEMRDWLRRALASSRARFRLVFFHHPPHSTAQHDAPATWMRWPYRAWGADLVVSGHQHCYERVQRDGMTYVVNGLGGHSWIYDNLRCAPVTGSQARFNARHGAMLLRANATALRGAFFDVEGVLVDEFTLASRRV